MIQLIAVVVVGIVVLGGLAFLAKRLGLMKAETGGERWPFRRKDFLLTESEKEFYRVLCKAVEGRWAVFAKVRLADLVWLPKGTQNAQSYRNRVQSKHVDFVLCERSAVKPVLAIELDDASHERESRQERDKMVDRVLSSAGLPRLRVRAKRAYAPAELKQQIDAALAAGG